MINRIYDAIDRAMAAAGRVLGHVWHLLKGAMRRIPGLVRFLEWATRPLQRWDDLREADRLTELAAQLRAHDLTAAANRCDEMATGLRGRWAA